MDYEKINWKNQPNKQTPINATNLNHMDDGIYEAHERINANSIISTSQGETILVTDSAKVPPENIKLFGKTTQITTEGKQLLKNPENFVNVVANSTDGESSDVLIKGSGEYTFSLILKNNTQSAYYLAFKNESGTNVKTVNAITSTVNINFTQEEADSITSVKTYVSSSLNGATIDYAMFNKGGNALPFEPYTGGKPSPSIDYPQELNSCGDDGSIEQALLGANLYNIYDKVQWSFQDCTIDDNDWCSLYYDNSSGDTTYYANVQVNSSKHLKPNTDYLIVTETEYISGCELFLPVSGMKQASSQGQFDGSATVSSPGIQINKITTRNDFTGCVTMLRTVVSAAPGNVCRLKYRISVLADLSVTTDTFVYEPYTEQILTALTPNGLKSIGDVADYKDYERGKTIQKIGAYIFTGEENFTKRGVTSSDAYQTYLEEVDFGNARILPLAMCTHYIYDKTNALVGGFYIMGHGFVSFTFAQYGTTTVDDIKALFAEKYAEGNPIKIIFELEEPIETDLTPEELAQYNALYMNYPNTTITNDSGAYMEVEYVASPKEYIANLEKKHDNDIKQLKTAIIALGGTI